MSSGIKSNSELLIDGASFFAHALLVQLLLKRSVETNRFRQFGVEVDSLMIASCCCVVEGGASSFVDAVHQGWPDEDV